MSSKWEQLREEFGALEADMTAWWAFPSNGAAGDRYIRLNEQKDRPDLYEKVCGLVTKAGRILDPDSSDPGSRWLWEVKANSYLSGSNTLIDNVAYLQGVIPNVARISECICLKAQCAEMEYSREASRKKAANGTTSHRCQRVATPKEKGTQGWMEVFRQQTHMACNKTIAFTENGGKARIVFTDNTQIQFYNAASDSIWGSAATPGKIIKRIDIVISGSVIITARSPDTADATEYVSWIDGRPGEGFDARYGGRVETLQIPEC